MPDIRPVVHLVIHLAAPGVVAGIAFRGRWLWAWGWMLATMVVDVDHLFADPVYDPNRCGIGFHPLHTWPAISGYAILLLVPAVRVVAAGLLVHMGADGLDCLWLKYL
jgi:hypothetical protein